MRSFYQDKKVGWDKLLLTFLFTTANLSDFFFKNLYKLVYSKPDTL